MSLPERDPISLLSRMVAVRSVSGEEEALGAMLRDLLASEGIAVTFRERNLVARLGHGGGPRVLLNSHLDTVPPTSGWTREPWTPEVVDGLLYGLGSNDAKASGAAMLLAFLELRDRFEAEGWPPGEVVLALTCEEERGRDGLERILPDLGAFDACIIGEPTELEIVRAQKGLLILELVCRGDVVHAAHAEHLEAANAITVLAEDLLRLRKRPPWPEHPLLGRTTITPTVLRGGSTRNRTPEEAVATLDCRTTPSTPHDVIIDTLRERLVGHIAPFSNRLHPVETPAGATLVRLALEIAGKEQAIGSSTMSDATHTRAFPTIKVGPGTTLLSHQPDEYVETHWLPKAVAFYRDLVMRLLGTPRPPGP